MSRIEMLATNRTGLVMTYRNTITDYYYPQFTFDKSFLILLYAPAGVRSE